MKYKLLGRSGLRVSEICLGTMTFGEEFGWGASKEESRKVFESFVEQGGNFFDTANYYTKGTSETFLGEFINGKRERAVIASKYSLCTDPKDPNACGNHRKNMMQAIHASLKRLKTDYLDLYWLHAWDYLTPVDEVMRSLDDLVRSGKILYVGVSDTPAWIISQANTMADFKGWSPFVALQLEYSLAERTIEREYFPMSHALDQTILAWSPLAGGVLTGKYSNKEDTKARFSINQGWGNRYLTERNLHIADEVSKIAKEAGKNPAQVALNWVRQQCENIIPIIGAKNVEQLRTNLETLNFELTHEQLERLNKVSHIDYGFPHDFLKGEGIRKVLFGEHTGDIENHRVHATCLTHNHM